MFVFINPLVKFLLPEEIIPYFVDQPFARNPFVGNAASMGNILSAPISGLARGGLIPAEFRKNPLGNWPGKGNNLNSLSTISMAEPNPDAPANDREALQLIGVNAAGRRTDTSAESNESQGNYIYPNKGSQATVGFLRIIGGGTGYNPSGTNVPTTVLPAGWFRFNQWILKALVVLSVDLSSTLLVLAITLLIESQSLLAMQMRQL